MKNVNAREKITGRVVALCRSPSHSFTKKSERSINLVAGLGVEGDAHYGKTVQHRSRVAKDPSQPNLRQVHLIQSELLEELQGLGYGVNPCDLGENITTAGLDILSIPTGTRLQVGVSVVIEVTGLRNPCSQIDQFKEGLMKAVLDRDAEGNLIRKSGVMGIVVVGGEIKDGDLIHMKLPEVPHIPLKPV